MRTQPLISIIVAVYNGSETLQQCIGSVINQTYSNRELIVIDGCSTDKTIDLLVLNQKNLSYWISEPDRGIYDAWNKGLKHATGDWIIFLGSDDYFYNERVLEDLVPFLPIVPSTIRIIYGQVMIVSKAGQALYKIGQPWYTIKKKFRQIMCIPHTGTFHHHSLFKLHGKFDESYRIAGDYEFLLRELKYSDAFFIEGCIVAAMRVGGIGSDPSNSIQVMCETRRAARKHGMFLPGWPWITAMINIYFKSALWIFLGDRRSRKLLDFARKVIKKKPPYWTKI